MCATIRILLFVVLATMLAGLYSMYELLTTLDVYALLSVLTGYYNPANALF